jgi:hypothetical protein
MGRFGVGNLEELDDFLRRLLADKDVRKFRPSYADLLIGSEGRVARLTCE